MSIDLIIGSLISGIVGLIVFIAHDKYREREEKKRIIQKIARGLKLEVESIQKKIVPIYMYINSTTADTSKYKFLHKMFTTIYQNLQPELIYKVGENHPLYSKDGWYYDYQKDLTVFNQSVIHEIRKFYETVISANQTLEIYFREFKSHSESNDEKSFKLSYMSRLSESFVDDAIDIHNSCPRILEILTKVIE